MSNRQRTAMLALGLVFAAIAVAVALSSGGDSSQTAAEPTSPLSSDSSATVPVTAPTSPTGGGSADTPKTPLLVSGKVAKISVDKGEQVRFRVRSKEAEELHIHGYDISKDLEAGKTTTVSFVATIDGVFEIELEGAGEQVAELTVNP